MYSPEPEHLCSSSVSVFHVLIHPCICMTVYCMPQVPSRLGPGLLRFLCPATSPFFWHGYLGAHKAFSKPIQAGLAVGEIAQIHILQLILEEFSQAQRQVVMAEDVVSVRTWSPGQKLQPGYCFSPTSPGTTSFKPSWKAFPQAMAPKGEGAPMNDRRERTSSEGVKGPHQ